MPPLVMAMSVQNTMVEIEIDLFYSPHLPTHAVESKGLAQDFGQIESVWKFELCSLTALDGLAVCGNSTADCQTQIELFKLI